MAETSALMQAMLSGGLGSTRSDVMDMPDMPVTAEGFGNMAAGKVSDLAGMPGDLMGLMNAIIEMRRGVPIQDADFSSSYGTEAIGEMRC